ncbi:hypothetical protein [Allorhizocola rhizosphaerae]|uniref:hypothetical protein n=1 Tax=Allorhizocola rhizosphaerae TaxID=1872709 RepID=UPI000E3EC73B|nr:hypothetical protein [Allorhizocola rhizosphaerae]
MTFDDISRFYTANQTLIASVGALAGVAVLLVAANRLRALKEHRATLLVANILTILAAALATAVSASGMWKFFTDILGETPLRIAFFAFIEIALFASALLARSRLLRDPQTGTTGIDGIAVWALAALTATLSALDSDSFREVCLRLVAPLVAAWMWERALAAERNVRLGRTARRINWAITPERIFVWLRLAEARDRDVSRVDRARRRAKLGRARLHLHLLQSKKSFAWRVRRAHRRVVKQAMQAAEHIGLADFPDATNERQAMQMYMATLYGFVDATSPQAVAHLNAWQHDTSAATHTIDAAAPGHALDPNQAKHDAAAETASTNGTKVLRAVLPGQAALEDASHPQPGRAEQANGRHFSTGTAVLEYTAPELRGDPELSGRREPDAATFGLSPDLDGRSFQAAGPSAAQRDGSGALDDDALDDGMTGDDRPDDEADLTAVAAMRRFWDHEVAAGRVPTGAELSRAAGVPPATGLGRRKRREWEAELPEHLQTAAGAGR